jgi:hypothetical protein
VRAVDGFVFLPVEIADERRETRALVQVRHCLQARKVRGKNWVRALARRVRPSLALLCCPSA